MAKLLVAGVALVNGISVEVSSNDISSITSADGIIDNIKASWDQTLKVFGKDATLTASYDRNEREDFLNEATLSGDSKDFAYEVTTNFDGDTELTISTESADGTSFEATANSGDGITEVKASRSMSILNQDCDVECTHEVASHTSKLKASTVLGGGVSATATVELDSAATPTYELEYEAELSKGRSISATVNPLDGEGEVEYTDTTTLDGTIEATMPLGGKPTVIVKRSWSF